MRIVAPSPAEQELQELVLELNATEVPIVMQYVKNVLATRPRKSSDKTKA